MRTPWAPVYLGSLAVIWCVPVGCWLALAWWPEPGDGLLLVAWLGLWAGGLVAVVLTAVVLPITVLSQWEERRRRRTG